MTGLEPATTRPPDVYANQLRYIPFCLRVQSYTLLPRKTNFLPSFFGKGAIYHYFFAKKILSLGITAKQEHKRVVQRMSHPFNIDIINRLYYCPIIPLSAFSRNLTMLLTSLPSGTCSLICKTASKRLVLPWNTSL